MIEVGSAKVYKRSDPLSVRSGAHSQHLFYIAGKERITGEIHFIGYLGNIQIFVL